MIVELSTSLRSERLNCSGMTRWEMAFFTLHPVSSKNHTTVLQSSAFPPQQSRNLHFCREAFHHTEVLVTVCSLRPYQRVYKVCAPPASALYNHRINTKQPTAQNLLTFILDCLPYKKNRRATQPSKKFGSSSHKEEPSIACDVDTSYNSSQAVAVARTNPAMKTIIILVLIKFFLPFWYNRDIYKVLATNQCRNHAYTQPLEWDTVAVDVACRIIQVVLIYVEALRWARRRREERIEEQEREEIVERLWRQAVGNRRFLDFDLDF